MTLVFETGGKKEPVQVFRWERKSKAMILTLQPRWTRRLKPAPAATFLEQTKTCTLLLKARDERNQFTRSNNMIKRANHNRTRRKHVREDEPGPGTLSAGFTGRNLPEKPNIRCCWCWKLSKQRTEMSLFTKILQLIFILKKPFYDRKSTRTEDPLGCTVVKN